MAFGTLADLLVLGRNSDPLSERGVSCEGVLPAASEPALVDRAHKARAALGAKINANKRAYIGVFACL